MEQVEAKPGFKPKERGKFVNCVCYVCDCAGAKNYSHSTFEQEGQKKVYHNHFICDTCNKIVKKRLISIAVQFPKAMAMNFLVKLRRVS